MKKVLLVAVSVLLVCTSCVTKKKYLLAENGRLEAIARGDDLQNQLVNCRDNNDGLTSRLASLERIPPAWARTSATIKACSTPT